METINYECYVSLEVAKLLKEAGFNWEIKTFYFMGQLGETMLGEAKNHNFSNQFISAPTLDVAQRWLREVKKHDVFVFPCNGLYFYTVRKYYHEGKVDYFDYPNKDAFDTYEKTLETGIQKALEILEKGDKNYDK